MNDSDKVSELVRDFYLNDYKSFREICSVVEVELGGLRSIPMMNEVGAASQHIMLAYERPENSARQIENARWHLRRAIQDGFELLISKKLEKLREMGHYLSEKELSKVKEAYLRLRDPIKNAVDNGKSDLTPKDYNKILQDLDSLIKDSDYEYIHHLVLEEKKKKTYRMVLFATISALIGALVSFLITRF